MSLSRRKWWTKYYDRSKRHLNSGWAEAVKEKFNAKRPVGTRCALRIGQNRVVHPTSRKSSCANAFTAETSCLGSASRKEDATDCCQRQYKLIVEDFPADDDICVPVKVLRKFYEMLLKFGSAAMRSLRFSVIMHIAVLRFGTLHWSSSS